MKRPSRPVRLGEALAGTIAPALRRQGFGEAEIVTAWPEIVGARLAGACAPIRLVWPTRGPKSAMEDAQPAALAVRVEGAFALELQHLAPLVVERINARLGWRCVDRLRLHQGPLPRQAPRSGPPPEPDAAARAQGERAAEGVEDEALRAAIARLGARVAQTRRGGPST
jgi:hypothetical protein